MSLPFERELDDLMKSHCKHRAHTAKLQRSIREICATATTPRQTITASIRDGTDTMVRGYTRTEKDNTVNVPTD
jgi:hypothetical protein